MNIRSYKHRPHKKKLRACLGPCGRTFMTTMYVRVCKSCREKLRGADDPEFTLLGRAA